MDEALPAIPTGYSSVPPGKLATIVTCLEMRARPAPRAPVPLDAAGGLRLERWHRPSNEAYRALFRSVGADWLWYSRLVMADGTLRALLDDDRVEVHVLMDGERQAGLLELDFRQAGQCELAFFGLTAETIGRGAGRFLMDAAIDKAFSAPIARFWVHTCHLDHHAALGFYRRSGFTPYAMLVEIMDDPRLTGVLPKSAAPHVPLIET